MACGVSVLGLFRFRPQLTKPTCTDPNRTLQSSTGGVWCGGGGNFQVPSTDGVMGGCEFCIPMSN